MILLCSWRCCAPRHCSWDETLGWCLSSFIVWRCWRDFHLLGSTVYVLSEEHTLVKWYFRHQRPEFSCVRPRDRSASTSDLCEVRFQWLFLDGVGNGILCNISCFLVLFILVQIKLFVCAQEVFEQASRRTIFRMHKPCWARLQRMLRSCSVSLRLRNTFRWGGKYPLPRRSFESRSTAEILVDFGSHGGNLQPTMTTAWESGAGRDVRIVNRKQRSQLQLL